MKSLKKKKKKNLNIYHKTIQLQSQSYFLCLPMRYSIVIVKRNLMLNVYFIIIKIKLLMPFQGTRRCFSSFFIHFLLSFVLPLFLCFVRSSLPVVFYFLIKPPTNFSSNYIATFIPTIPRFFGFFPPIMGKADGIHYDNSFTTNTLHLFGFVSCQLSLDLF